MKIQFASDLHLEMGPNRNWLKLYPIQPVAPYLILAGDIFVLNRVDEEIDYFIDYFSANWEQVYIVPGNHENYAYG